MPPIYDPNAPSTSAAPGDGRRPFYRPFERNTLENLLAYIRQGGDASVALGMFQETRQSALDRILAQRAARQEALGGLGTQLTEAALAGVQPAGLEALVGLQTAANPALGRPAYQSRLDELVSSAGTLAQNVPTEQDAAAQLSAEELQVMQDDIRNFATGLVRKPDGSPYSLTEAYHSIGGQLRLAGYDEATISRVREFIAAKWAEFGGPISGQAGQGAAGLQGKASAFTPEEQSAGAVGLGLTPEELRGVVRHSGRSLFGQPIDLNLPWNLGWG